MEKNIEQFKVDVARFSGNYQEFLILAKTRDGGLVWRSTDDAWGVGAATRYLLSRDEEARIHERKYIDQLDSPTE